MTAPTAATGPRENGVKKRPVAVTVALWPLSPGRAAGCDGPATGPGRDDRVPQEEPTVSDLVYVLVTAALFAALALVVRGVERL